MNLDPSWRYGYCCGEGADEAVRPVRRYPSTDPAIARRPSR